MYFIRNELQDGVLGEIKQVVSTHCLVEKFPR
jgi:hypothetical protein